MLVDLAPKYDFKVVKAIKYPHQTADLTSELDSLGDDVQVLVDILAGWAGAIREAEQGKHAGCWVMRLADAEEGAGEDEKVIVRSSGTVTYVGKDIAYQLWKFGLLGRDFHYRFWQEEGVWETSSEETPAGEAPGEAPSFGAAGRVVNVIDARQSYLQRVVRAGLEALGHRSEAERSIHFAYEMVSLSRRTAEQLGYLEADDGEEGRPALEMSGRKGIGVKGDDLLDQMEAKARDKIVERYPDLAPALAATGGRLWPLGWARLLWARSHTHRYCINGHACWSRRSAVRPTGWQGPVSFRWRARRR